jgi:hypothetical protein
MLDMYKLTRLDLLQTVGLELDLVVPLVKFYLQDVSYERTSLEIIATFTNSDNPSCLA